MTEDLEVGVSYSECEMCGILVKDNQLNWWHVAGDYLGEFPDIEICNNCLIELEDDEFEDGLANMEIVAKLKSTGEA